jgi:hypothetical protein
MKSIQSKKGRAGELLVAGELLRQGFDVYLPLVDTGIDLICLVNHKPVFIQVKESREYQLKKKKRYWQRISETSLINTREMNMFYIFVLKSERQVNYLVLPSEFLYGIKNQLYRKDDSFWLYFDFEGDKVVEGRRSHIDLTKYLNNFDQIKQI